MLTYLYKRVKKHSEGDENREFFRPGDTENSSAGTIFMKKQPQGDKEPLDDTWTAPIGRLNIRASNANDYSLLVSRIVQ